MTVGLIAALVIAAPLILAPVALVWYLNVGGLVGLIRERREKPAGAKAAA